MPRYVGMRDYFLQGLLWLYLLGFGLMALSLEPGFLDFDNLPDTNFSCVGKVIGGYYADLETNCQMFHVCTIGQLDEPMDIRFLCLNGTVFDQETRVCERIDEVDCSKSEQFYSLNLELYGNSQPATLEENSETEQPLIIKSTPSTTTSPPPPSSTNKPSRPPFYATTTPPPPQRKGTTAVSHRFPGVNPNSADIRFNPEEINISLHPGAPPDIRTKQHQQQHYQSYSDNKLTNSENSRVVATTTDRVVVDNSKSQAQNVLYNRPTPGDINYEFTFRQTDDGGYGTEQTPPSQDYHYRKPFRPSQEYSVPFHNDQFKPTTYRTEYRHPTTQKVGSAAAATATTTTTRTYFVHPQRNHYVQHRTERPPQRLQLPLPLLPSLAPISFSSPAPFTLRHHIDAKRYTKDHQPPPRIIISASASVSDASGRRLNYSLGTIGPAEILEERPYDDYKDHDEVLGLEHFYHDVPKLKLGGRSKRSAQLRHSDVIRNDEDAVRVLKFLFDWYRSEKTNPAKMATTPLSAVQINDELLQDVQPASRYGNNSVANGKQTTTTSTATPSEDFKDYVDDNYEPETYRQYERSRYNTGDAEGSKNYTLSLDYVDDNIEPLYYRGGEEDKNKILEQRSSSEITESYLENHTTAPTEQTIDTTTSAPPQHHNTEVSFVTEINEHQTPDTSETLVITIHEDVTKSDDTSPIFKPTTKASRGRRKFHHSRKASEQEQDIFKNVLIEKLIERPYRAQDDYNFLRTLSNVHSSTTKVLTSDDTLVATDEVSSSNSNEPVLITTSTTTERTSQTINRRRGRHRYTNEDRSRRKSKEVNHEEQKSTLLRNEILKTLPSLKSVINNNTYETPVEALQTVNRTVDVALPTDVLFKPDRNNTGNENTLHQKLFEEISKSFQDNLSTTESLFDKNFTYAQINRIDEVYPKSPPVDVHITKKKQLKITVVDTTLTPDVETTTSNEDIIVEESKESLQIPTTTAFEYITSPTTEDVENYTTQSTTQIVKDYTTSSPNENIKENNISEDYTTSPITEGIEHYTTQPTTENVKDYTTEGIDYYTTQPTIENVKDYTTWSSSEDIKENNISEDNTSPPTENYNTPSTTEENIRASTDENIKDSITTNTVRSYVTDAPSWTANDLQLYVKEVESTTKIDVTISHEVHVSHGPTTTETTTEIIDSYVHLIDAITENIPTTTTTTKREEIMTEPQSITTTEKIETTTIENVMNDSTISEQIETTTEPVAVTTTEAVVPTTILQETTTEPPGTTTTTPRPSRRRNGRRRPTASYQRSPTHRHRFNAEHPRFSAEQPRSNAEQPQSNAEQPRFKAEQPTDAPLWRSASPTQRDAKSLPTTPLSRRTTVTKRYFFNCFNKKIDRFYPDPRDCRLFHYCTQGYNENQLLDMKFVCDLNTYFDDENLVCTKQRPRRCL